MHAEHVERSPLQLYLLQGGLSQQHLEPVHNRLRRFSLLTSASGQLENTKHSRKSSCMQCCAVELHWSVIMLRCSTDFRAGG